MRWSPVPPLVLPVVPRYNCAPVGNSPVASRPVEGRDVLNKKTVYSRQESCGVPSSGSRLAEVALKDIKINKAMTSGGQQPLKSTLLLHQVRTVSQTEAKFCQKILIYPQKHKNIYLSSLSEEYTAMQGTPAPRNIQIEDEFSQRFR